MVDICKLSSVSALAEQIISARLALSPHRTLLVGISGIDGSGKGYITRHLEKQLREARWNIAVIAADDWHNLPNICIGSRNPVEHFYEHALRLGDMFEQLVVPLCEQGSVDIVADCANAKATVYRKRRYNFRGIDIVLLEGIFLFKPAYRDHFNLKIWIDCSFATALQRAIVRAQEGLSPAETKRAFETIYFPAQQLHLERDQPNEHTDVIFHNDIVPDGGNAG
jgi:uridine kinase